MMAMLTFSFSCTNGREFAHGHLEAAVADHDPYIRFGPRHLRADRCRQGEAHRPQASGGDQAACLLMLVVLCFPHLVLADIGHYNSVAVASLAPQIIDHVRCVKVSAVRQVLNIAHSCVTLQLVDRVEPFTAIDGLDVRQQFMQHLPQVADEGNVYFHVLVDLRRINLDVNLLRILGIGLEVSGHAVIEPHAESQQQIRFLDGMVHPGFPVHAHHARG